MRGKIFGDAATEFVFKQSVEIDGGAFEQFGKGGGDSRLAGSHEACEENIFHGNAIRIGDGFDLAGLGVCQDKNDGL